MRGLFWKPGIGVGPFYGKRLTPTDSLTLVSTVAGAVVKLDLGMAFYATRHVNLKAGPEVMFSFGKETPEIGQPEGFQKVDGGFAIGFAYTF